MDNTASGKGYELQTGGSGLIYFQVVNTYSTNGIEIRSSSNTNYYDGKWHHFVGTYDGSSNASGMKIYFDGKQIATTTSFNNLSATITTTAPLQLGQRYNANQLFIGQLDQAQIYNYALSASQVAWNYNRGMPIAYWKMNECQGSSIYDSSGNGLTGTINMGVLDITSVGTCATSGTAWGNGATGKYNASVSFDDSDDYISVASPNLPTGDFSYSAWFNSTGGSDVILAVSDGSGGDELRIRKDSSNIIQVLLNNTQRIQTTQSVTLGVWNHVVVTRSGSVVKAYINGRLDPTTGTDGTALNFSTCPLLIGADNDTSGCTSSTANFFKGQIDEVQVFNYPLTDAQVKLLYNQNSAVRFGPSTGTP
jgi:hypothetical protein